MKEEAIVLSGGIYDDSHAKTAHGLVRTSSKYQITGVIDDKFYDQDAGVLLDGIQRDILIYGSIDAYLEKNDPPKFCIIGVAYSGGTLPDAMKEEVIQAIRHGISIVSGLHVFLSDSPELSGLAKEYGVDIIDIRKPKPKDQLKFWSGEIMDVKCPIVAVLGTDCALGKRTTATFLAEAFKEHNRNAEMVFTGQTGWLQGHSYGFIFDSTYNDFVSGELEHAIVSCYRALDPEIIFLEGQASLCNPSGPCGSEYLLSGQARGIVLQHNPQRGMFVGHEATGLEISLARDLALIKTYGSETIAITLNTEGITLEEAEDYKLKCKEEFGIPVILPIEEGVDELYQLVSAYIERFKKA